MRLEWADDLFKENKWLGTDSNLLGTDSVAKILVTYYNKMSPDHKVDYFGIGGVPTIIYEKAVAFALYQVKRRIKGNKGGLAGQVNLTQQHLQQHAEYVEMLRYIRTIIASGDCMLGADGSVEIHATADDVRVANKASAKALEGMDENDKRYKDAKDFI